MRSPVDIRGILGRSWLSLAAALALAVTAAVVVSAAGQPAPAQHGGQAPAQATEAASTSGHAAAAEGEGLEHGEPLWKAGARLFNFAILAGTLVYFLRAPMKAFFDGRLTLIRSELVRAAGLKQQAGEEIAAVERRLAALPGELKSLAEQGAADIAAERERIRLAAEADRRRLLDQARRQMELKVSVAERELAARAADLVIARATDLIRRETTAADQARLVDRYLAQVPAAGDIASQASQGGRP